MKFTNLHNLPAPMVAALSGGWPPNPKTLSVSSLIGPPRIRTLLIRHWDRLEEDVSGRLWALLGTALHDVLASHASGKEVLAEQSIKTEVGGILVSGRPDLYHDGIVDDYKITSVFSFLLGDKPEWTDQLNVYAFLFRSQGFPVTALNIHAILRDWVESKTLTDPEYPKIPFVTVPIDLWSIESAEEYVADRVARHLKYPMDPCSDKERWGKPPTYAVFKVGGKRALRVLDTAERAQEWGKEHQAEKPKDKLEIHERPGSFVRCERFCPVRAFCELNPYNNPAPEEAEWEELQ